MDDTQLLDCTQALSCDLDEEEEEEPQQLVAWLEVNENRHEIYSGRNIIGRDPAECKIVIPSKVLSRQHAVVEVVAGTHTLADLGSSNKTRLGKMVLRPHVQYALQGGEGIKFGNVEATYTIKPEVCDDSGSETGSESMLLMLPDQEERSPSPVLSSTLNHSDTQGELQEAVQNDIIRVSASSQNSSTPQAKGTPSHGTSLPHLADSFLQPSDAESSVISATQSPTGRTFAALSPQSTSGPDPEEYNSDESTDVEDNVSVQPCPTAHVPKTPPHASPTTSVPETPSHLDLNTVMVYNQAHISLNISIPEIPVGSSPNTSVQEVPVHTSPNTSEAPVHTPLTTAIVEIPSRAHKDDHLGKGPDMEDLLFKKPLALSPLKTSRTPTKPTTVASSQKSSVVSKDSEAVSVQSLTGSSDTVDCDAQTSDSVSDVDIDAPIQVCTNSMNINLDVPTQRFTSGSTNYVDLDAPTQVFTGDTSVDLDAPTQVFTTDTSVDLDAPTQVFTNNINATVDAPAKFHVNDSTNDDDLDAPTQVFTNDTNVDIYAPTQVFTNDTSVDLDAATQVFNNDSVDLDASTQVFNNDTSVDLDAPTQVFTNDTSVDFDAPTQVFTSDTSVDLDAPTQVFTGNEPIDDVPTQVFTNDRSVDLNAPMQKCTSSAPDDDDLDPPTQVFTNDASNNIESSAPTQMVPCAAPHKDVENDLDVAAHPLSSSSTLNVDTNNVRAELSCGNIGLSGSQGSTERLPLLPALPGDDPPSSTALLCNPGEVDIPTQPFSDSCTGGPRPSKSIVEAWDHLESNTNLSTNTATLLCLGKGDLQESEAASDASESLFNEEDEACSHHSDEEKTCVFEGVGNNHKLKEDYQSDESTDIEETPTDAIVQSSHKIAGKAISLPSVQSKDSAVECHVNKGRVINEMPNNQVLEVEQGNDAESYRHSPTISISRSGEGALTPADAQSTDPITKCGKQHKQITHSEPQTPKSIDSQESIPINVSLSDCCFALSEASNEISQAGELDKERTGLPDLIGDSESEEEDHVSSSMKLFDLSSDGERDEGKEKEQRALITSTRLSPSQGSKEGSESSHSTPPYRERTGHPNWLSESESEEEDANNSSLKLFDLVSGTEENKIKGREQRVLAFSTRRASTRLGSSLGSTSQHIRKKHRAVSRASLALSTSASPALASNSTPIHITTQVSAPPSSLDLIPNSIPAPSSTTTTTITTTNTNTNILLPAPTRTRARASARASVPVDSPVPAPATRRRGRKCKGESKTDSTSNTSPPVLVPIPTRKCGERSTDEGEVDPATTITSVTDLVPITNRRRSKRNMTKEADLSATTTACNNMTVTTVISTTTVIPAAIVVTATTTSPSTSAVTPATTPIPPQCSKAKRRTRPQRVIHQPNVNARHPEVESLNVVGALLQPCMSAIIDNSSSSATNCVTRSRRGKQATTPPVLKIKSEVIEQENVQMTTFTTIKQEKEEIEAPACEQSFIKVEPQDDLPGERSERARRSRRKPDRYSPERDLNFTGKKLRSRSLPSAGSSGTVKRENTGNARELTTNVGNTTPKNVAGQQRRTQGVLATTQPKKEQEIVAAPVVKTEGATLEDFDRKPSEALVSSFSALPQDTDPPPKKNRQTRASNGRFAQQAAPPRAAKKIKMEVISEEDCLEVPQSRVTQPRTKRTRASDYKKEEFTKRLNQNPFSRQQTKRRNSDASDSASSTSNTSFSSRATRSNKDVELWSPSKRQRQASTKPRVLFTGYHDPADHKIVIDLGGRTVETPLDCTVLVTTGLKRTCKLLSAIGRGCPIVSPNWLTVSKAAGNFVDSWQFLLKDHQAEEKYGFCLEDTIKSANNFLLFEGLSMHATPSVQPPPCQMRDIVECAGGDYLHTAPKKYEPHIRIISCPEDRRLWPSFKSLGIPILGVEFILTGLLRHELLLEEFVLG